jgi:glutamate-ammonia-ligase adenylyltransferase
VSLSTLARLGFEEPEAATADLERLGAWPPAAAPGGKRLLADIAASAAPQLAARSLAAVAAAHPDPAGFTARLRGRLGFRRRLVPVVAASRSLGAFLATHPEEADRLADGRRFTAPRPRGDLVAEATALVAGAPPRGSPGPSGRRPTDPLPAGPSWDGLRRFKRRELLRVAVRDLAGQVPVEQVAAELAELADACLEAALQVAAGESGYDPPPMRLAVLGMGKLGGTELNYVSDIDVLFCHEPVPGAEAEAAARAAERVARGVIRGLSAVTAEGTCFEVDANLRPEGRNGPLSRTLGSYLAYWDRWAQPWERQALIKVRPVAGDQALAERFCAEAEARVYVDPLDPTTVAEVRRMKARVESERLPAGADPKLHLKLGPGGLADVEWTVQLLQLRVGGARPEVRVQHTLGALEALAGTGALDAGQAGWLADAYRLCLRVRNLAYLVAGRPVDTLPTDPVALERLARAMGEPGRQRLLEDHRRATRRARRVVDALFWDDGR